MSRSRHMKRASGGKAVAYTGGDSNVMKEAHERKRGGRVHREHQEVEGEHAKHRADKRARGGKIHHRGDTGHTSHHEEGHMHAKPHHMPGRKRGGGIGADKTPLSSAARIKEITKGELGEDAEKNPKGTPNNP